MIVSLTKQNFSDLIQRSFDQPLHGFGWQENDTLVSALPIQKIGAFDWATDGVIGQKISSDNLAKVMKQTFSFLNDVNGRILLAFAELPLMHFSGTVQLMEAEGVSKEDVIELIPANDSKEFADLVKKTQLDSIDFNEIPSPPEILDSYLGHGTSLWRQLDNRGALILNPVDNGIIHLAFIGLIASARRQGFGRQLIEAALALTGSERMLTTAVDTRNIGACRLYDSMGFKTTAKRPVYFSLLQDDLPDEPTPKKNSD